MTPGFEPAGTVRERRHAETVAEIKQAALQRMADGGAPAMSLRAVARDVGVSVQALYHYFPSRDALLTSLITDSFADLAGAVRTAGTGGGEPWRERVVRACLAYRRWALTHRSEFLLALGVPIPDYAAPPDGPTTGAAAGLGRAFRDVLFGDWTAEDLARLPLPSGLPALDARLRSAPQPWSDLPPGAFAQYTLGWATLHGLVMLELLGHVPWIGDAGEEMCRAALETHLTQLDALRSGEFPEQSERLAHT